MSSGIDSETFRQVCARFATGVAIAAVRAPDGAPHGLTVNSFTSVSLSPPLILICIGDLCQILPVFRASPFFSVNFLTPEQQPLANAFAERTDNRFDGIEWYAAPNGSPLIPGALGWMECRTEDAIEAGDHTIFIGEVAGAGARDGAALVYFNRSYSWVK
ncbi:MAG TPA: flavin reductase family protein [Bryobacteraceae bacterium]|nr:flavin reductase family protein [Bryobacteraceae bacterium]